MEDKPTLVQLSLIAWCCQATSHYLSPDWSRPVSPYDIGHDKLMMLGQNWFHNGSLTDIAESSSGPKLSYSFLRLTENISMHFLQKHTCYYDIIPRNVFANYVVYNHHLQGLLLIWENRGHINKPITLKNSWRWTKRENWSPSFILWGHWINLCIFSAR